MAEQLLIFTKGGGRLANQLFNVVHLLAWQKEKAPGLRMCVFSFWPYASLFKIEGGNEIMLQGDAPAWIKLIHQVYKQLPHPWNRRYLKLIIAMLEQTASIFNFRNHAYPETDHIVLDLEDVHFNKQITNSRKHLLSGWLIRSWRLVNQHQHYIREKLQPSDDYFNLAFEKVQNIRASYDYVVGVQIRHGDYRHWRDGAYFHTTEEYVAWMHNIYAALANKQMVFLVTSDEYQDPKLFEGLPVVFSSGSVNEGGHYLQSILELSRCDIICGPNSTFSAWAALFGDKPLYWKKKGDSGFDFSQKSSLFDLKDSWFI